MKTVDEILDGLSQSERVEALRLASEFALSHSHPISMDSFAELQKNNQHALDVYAATLLEGTRIELDSVLASASAVLDALAKSGIVKR